MIAEWGESLLVSALCISLVRLSFPLMFYRKSVLVTWRGQQLSALCELICLTAAMGTLIVAYAVSDFSIKNVAENSHSELSLFYRVSASWGNHEGSMLLWLWILSLYGSVITRQATRDIAELKVHGGALGLHALLVALINLYILLTSNPFLPLKGWVMQGQELNPLLQDPALAIHPPILYLGYIGFAVPFCYALSLAFQASPFLQGRLITWIRPWVLWSWGCLTLGIGLGSLWAYYELGWGGWWFWDPVENASLMPWLTGTALLHTLFVAQKSATLFRSTWYLSVVSFILCLTGTFLVRSGALTTVHAFANDSSRGLCLLLVIGITLAISLAGAIRHQRFHDTSSRILKCNIPGLVSIMVYTLTVLTVTIFTGTLYPLLIDAVGGTAVSVGGPYYQKTFIPIALLLVLMMGFAGWLKWHSVPFKAAIKRNHWGFFILVFAASIIIFHEPEKITAWLALTGGMWMIGMTLTSCLLNHRGSLRWRKLFAPMAIAHIGCGVMIVGMAADHLGNQECVIAAKAGEKFNFAGFELQLTHINRWREATYMAEAAQINVLKDARQAGVLSPEKRFYPSYEALITKTALLPHGLTFLYVVLGGILPDDCWTLRLYYHPLILLIWVGGAIMALGAFIALVKHKKGGAS